MFIYDFEEVFDLVIKTCEKWCNEPNNQKIILFLIFAIGRNLIILLTIRPKPLSHYIKVFTYS